MGDLIFRSCTEMRCYHGAECIMDRSGLPDCICPSGCFFNDYSDLANITICGSDGNTYDNFCELTKFACKHQLDLVPASLGICHSQGNCGILSVFYSMVFKQVVCCLGRNQTMISSIPVPWHKLLLGVKSRGHY